MSYFRNFFLASLAASALLAVLGPKSATAQFGGPPPPQGPAREVAPIDLTGQWVAIVTEDWRFRMITPPQGDFVGIPLNRTGRQIGEAWDPVRDEAADSACKSYGAAVIMRVPGRLRIAWRGDSTLEVQTDAGRQTRVFQFGAAAQPPGEPTWQGVSAAEWLLHRAGPRGSARHGTLEVVTTGMKDGYLRKNGAPYSGGAVVTEYFDLLEQPDGSQWLIVKTIVEDPTYLTQPYITSSQFRKQTDRSGWDPKPCAAQ
jgi:hypothetical protein